MPVAGFTMMPLPWPSNFNVLFEQLVEASVCLDSFDSQLLVCETAERDSRTRLATHIGVALRVSCADQHVLVFVSVVVYLIRGNVLYRPATVGTAHIAVIFAVSFLFCHFYFLSVRLNTKNTTQPTTLDLHTPSVSGMSLSIVELDRIIWWNGIIANLTVEIKGFSL